MNKYYMYVMHTKMKITNINPFTIAKIYHILIQFDIPKQLVDQFWPILMKVGERSELETILTTITGLKKPD